MKVIRVSSYDHEYCQDNQSHMTRSGLTQEEAELICRELQQNPDRPDGDWYYVIPDNPVGMTFKKCSRIFAKHIVPGWGCCKCGIYNGYQRENCRRCGHRSCYEFKHGEVVPGSVSGRGLVSLRLGIDVLRPVCTESHEPMSTTVEILGSGGDYETTSATACRKCGQLLSVSSEPREAPDGDAD